MIIPSIIPISRSSYKSGGRYLPIAIIPPEELKKMNGLKDDNHLSKAYDVEIPTKYKNNSTR